MTDRSAARPDPDTPRARIDPAAAKPTCQYCLADPRCTPIALRPHPRCPVCGAPHSGPRREREYRVLVEAGLVATDDERPADAKRPASDWCAQYGIVVHADDDGWSGEDAPAWSDPITLADFARRIARSRVTGGDLRRLMDDAARAARREEAGRP